MQQSVYDRDGFFERYQQLRSNSVSLNEIVEKPTMLSLLPSLTGKKLLDLGCGCGEHLALYLQLGAEFVVGVDLSRKMLAQAEQNLQIISQNRPHFALYQLEMEKLEQLPENEFDVITSSLAFHYIADFPALLCVIKAKLKPQGVLVFSQEHPITTCHLNGERWEKDENKRQVAYRLNYYRDEGVRERNWFKQPFKTYHRKLSTILNDLIQAEFQIECVEEPMLAEQPEWQREFSDLQHRPMLLFVRATLI